MTTRKQCKTRSARRILSCLLTSGIWLCLCPALADEAKPLLVGTISEEQALNDALLTGPRAAAARETLGITQAQMKQAKIYPNPAFETDNGYAELSYRYGVNFTVEPPWKMVLRILVAKAEIGKAGLQIQQTLWKLRGDSRRAYTELVIAQESAEMFNKLFELTGQLFDAANKRFSVGDVAKLDVFKAGLARTQAQIESEQAQRRIVQAREQLNIIMGKSESLPTAVPALQAFQLRAETNQLLPDLTRPLPPESQFIADAMENRLEIRIVKQSTKSAIAQRKQAVGNIWPNAQLAVGYDKQVNFPPEKDFHSWYFIASQPLPLFDRQQGELARLNATIKQLRFEQGSQENIVKAEVALAYRKVWNARENIRRYQDTLLEESERVAELGRLSYRLGQTDITSALIAQQANIQVRNNYLNEVLNYQQAFTDLEQATGRILQ